MTSLYNEGNHLILPGLGWIRLKHAGLLTNLMNSHLIPFKVNKAKWGNF